ncbi:MAG TPA: TonB-dependent receptor [Bryobacteraceae bacterium]|jgi:iron complex outermembrane receptor protein|nr:TonB-dependent receptor [Bryobacteraceae bacterium]
MSGAGYDQGSPDQTSPEALKNLSLEQLSQIEVTTPSKEPQLAFRTPMAIYVITGEDIRRSGATCIPEALRLAPGVEVARIDANKWAIGIRGFGSRLSRSVLVLIDGRTVYTTLFDGTYWEVQDTLMDDIDRIEVIRGPGGVIWGPNAVDGVINVITKSSKDTQGMLASGGGGNVEQGFANFRYGGGNGDGITYRLYAKAFTRGPEYHPDHDNFDDWRAGQGGFRVDWTKSSRDSFTVQGDIYDEEAGERVTATSYAPPYSVNVDANADLSGGNVVARWKRILSEGDDLQLQVYYDRTNRHEPNLGELRNTFDLDFLDRFRLPARQEITWGLGARLSRGDDIEVVSGLTFVPAKRTDQLFSAFIQDEIGIVPDRLSLTLGTKFLRTNFTGLELQPSARLAWTPTEKQTFWTSFTHAVRTPSDVEEDFFLLGYIATTPGGVPYFARFNANPNFAPEQLNSYEAGYRRFIKHNLAFGISTFYNHYHGLFSEDIIGEPYLETTPAPIHYLLPAQFRNGLLGTTKGFEIVPEWRPKDFWRLRGSYSFLNMDLMKAPHSGDVGTAPGIEGSSPKNEGIVESALDLPRSVQFDLTYRFVSALPGEGVRGYSTGDARLAWRVKRELELSLGGQNLLQPYHFEFGGDPGTLVGIRRSAYAEIRWMK